MKIPEYISYKEEFSDSHQGYVLSCYCNKNDLTVRALCTTSLIDFDRANSHANTHFKVIKRNLENSIVKCSNRVSYYKNKAKLRHIELTTRIMNRLVSEITGRL